MTQRVRTASTVAFLLAIAIGTSRASVDPAVASIWEGEEFKKAFLGTYGIHPDVEPSIGTEDRAVLEQVYPLLGSDPAKAQELLLAARTPESSAVFDFVLGNLAFQDDRLEEAERHYRDAVTRFPSFQRAWRNLGLIQARDQRYDEAIGSFTTMIELGGGDAISLGLLATAYLSRRDYLAAETAFRQALLLEPENASWRIGLARSVVKQEKFEEAVALLAVLIEREPERSEYWLLQANAFLGMKQPLRAAENLEMIAMLGKASAESFALLGDIYLNEGQIDLATSAYLRATEGDSPQPADRLFRAAELLAARGAMTQARELTAQIRTKFGSALDPGQSLDLVKLEARIAASAGDADAGRLLDEVVARDPLDGQALLLAGQQQLRSGDPDRAMLYFERAAGIDGFEAQAKLQQAQLLVDRAKYAEALPLLRRVQEIKPREQVALYLEQVERLARVPR
jgi:tetratricopeptide (TPR) repeat protein